MDQRSAAYGNLHASMVEDSSYLRGSARRTLSFLAQMLRFRSVLDVGCGVGIWLTEAAAMPEVKEVFGIDGPWLDRSKLLVDGAIVSQRDLEAEIDLGRQFDLVMSLEVAEHISPEAAPVFVKSLVRHSDAVLFSAAVPAQGGAHHVNEQWPSYWQRLFAEHDYVCVDVLRPNLWNDVGIGCWYRQNMLLFIRAETLSQSPELGRWAVSGIVPALIHPDLFIPSRRREMEYQRVIDLMSQGGDFRVNRNSQGMLTISRI
jgi:SAM-dependent methyltransferase